MLTASLLAIDFSDPQVWIYVIFTLLGLLGAIFGKKKGQASKDAKGPPAPPPSGGAPGGPSPRHEPSTPQRRSPTAPGRSQPPRPQPPRPAPARPAPARPPAQRGPTAAPRTGPAPPKPRSPHTEPRAPANEIRMQSARAAEPVVAGHAHPAQTDTPAPPPPVLNVPGFERRRVSAPGQRARDALRTKQELRAAFVLSEVLAPPVALRENHLP